MKLSALPPSERCREAGWRASQWPVPALSPEDSGNAFCPSCRVELLLGWGTVLLLLWRRTELTLHCRGCSQHPSCAVPTCPAALGIQPIGEPDGWVEYTLTFKSALEKR